MNIRDLSDRAGRLLLGAVPAGVAAAWVPIRADLPNVDVALVLVVVVAGVATAGGRSTGVVGSLAAVVGFDFFDTEPYGQLLITGASDVVTALVLLAASLLVAELAVALRGYRQMASRRGEDFTVMASAARLVSVGEDAGMVVGALAEELVSRLDLKDCAFAYGAPPGDRPCISRDGRVVGPYQHGATELDLPVWSGTVVRGHYRLVLKTPSPPPPDRLLAAVGISEQAGAALATQLVDPAPPSRPRRPQRLRLVR